MVEIYSDRWIAKNGAIPTSTWVATIGHLTENQIGQVIQACIQKCAEGDTWPPDLAEFLSLVAQAGANPFGLTRDDVMGEYKRWRNETWRYDSADQFPWLNPVLYHICIELRSAVNERRLTVPEMERYAEKLLSKWVKHVQNGFSIPPIRKRLAPPQHPPGPTPAQILYEKYLRRKAEENAKK